MAPVRKAGGGEATPSLTKVVSELKPRRLALSTLDTQLADTLRVVEEKLREHVSTRVSTCIELEVQDGQGTTWSEVLAFGKWDNKWQLLLESGLDEDPEGWKTQPLVTAAREKRVKVFTDGHMEKLIREAAKQLDAQIAEREAALKIASNLIEALDGEERLDDIPF